MNAPIPFTRLDLCGKELPYISEALAGGHTHGDGPFTRRCEALIQGRLECERALLTCSGTLALEMALILNELRPGDEVIMPSFTFVSTANAAVLRGAVPVFVDIRPDTINLDEKLLASAITPRTRGIIPVHYAGVSCEMDEINAIAAEHGLFVVEDAAHGYGASYRSRALGTLGDLGMISFHQTKNLGCGEGGVLLINRSRYSERAEIIREKGTNRSLFLRGEVDKYTWCDIGSSYLPSDILAAYLLAQCEAADQIIQTRMASYQRYVAALAGAAQRVGVGIPQVPEYCEHNAHLFFLVMPDGDARDRLQAHLKQHGVSASSHYEPLHASHAGRRYARAQGNLEHTMRIARNLLRLPLYASMTLADVDRVCALVMDFFKKL